MDSIVKATIQGRIRASGGGYAFFIPKALVDCNVIEGGKIYTVEIKEVATGRVVEQVVVEAKSKAKEKSARCGIVSLVLPEHRDLVLFRPGRVLGRSLLWDAPVFEQVLEVSE